jgi:hypothetical protein
MTKILLPLWEKVPAQQADEGYLGFAISNLK